MSSKKAFSQIPILRLSSKQIAISGALIFLIAFGVRLLSWHDTRREVEKVQTVVAANYQGAARSFQQGGARGFFRTSDPLADPNLLGHPPGYPIVVALVWSIWGESNAAIQLFQISADALAAVLIFLIAIKLLPFAVGVIAGTLVAFAPQFTWNSVLLLPDTLSVLPLLLAVYLLTHALERPRFTTVMVAGMLVGVSCWLRANALLLAPFLALVGLLLFARTRRLHYAGALLAGAIIIIAPMTIRNWIVFDHFIPVSLGAGQTMLEGISDYDPERRFGIPNTDMGIMKMEAEDYNRPDYYSTLFAPDGIQRERMRLARAARVIRNNPLWFLGVMIRRAGSMLRLERARLISPEPSVTNQLDGRAEVPQIWLWSPDQWRGAGVDEYPGVELEVLPDAQMLRVVSNQEKKGIQLQSLPITVRPDHDYVFRLPVIVSEGRMAINVVGAESGRVFASGMLEKTETREDQPQPTKVVELAFVAGRDKSIRLTFNNAAPESGRSVINIGPVELFDLGPASFLWTRYPRLLINGIQRLFITAVMLPLGVIGFFILMRQHAWKTLVLLLAVPAYYLCFQSLLHTEYRYVLAIHYFLFVLAAVAVYQASSTVLRYIRQRRLSFVPVSDQPGLG